MPRRNIPFYPDQYYHFYNRGNNRQTVFFADDNYHYFLRGMKKYLLPYVDVLAYCLMPTHYHLLVRVRPRTQTSEVCNRPSEHSSKRQGSELTPIHTAETSEVLISSRVSHAMQLLGISYTKAINNRYERVGSLFQGQFQGKIVQDSAYLRSLCFYIHANPVKDGLAALPEDWAFSNYREWVQLRAGKLVNHEFIEDYFGTPEEYKTMLMLALQNRSVYETRAEYSLT